MQCNIMRYLWLLYEQYLIQCIAPHNALLVQQSWIKYSIRKLAVYDTITLSNCTPIKLCDRTLLLSCSTTLSLVRLLLKIKNASLIQRCPLPRGSADNREIYSRRHSQSSFSLAIFPHSFLVDSQKFFVSKKEKKILNYKYYNVHNTYIKIKKDWL